MADSKISALPASTTPLAGTEVLPIVQSSTTKQVSVANLTAGRTFDALGMTLTSTDAGANEAPTLDLYRDSASPAVSDTLGEIQFNGEDSAGNKQKYACIHGSILSPTSTAEAGQIHFETQTAGASTEKMIIGTTNLVINEIGAVFNVRIEGDTDANLFYTDATNSRVGVGTISPATKLDVNGTITSTGVVSSGDFYLGTTSSSGGWFSTVGNNAKFGWTNLTNTATAAVAGFYNSLSVNVGTITTDAISTSFNTTSDYRLKENVQPMTGALAKVAQLKPVTYKWIANGADGQGFIAHELAEVVPDCVTGEKDAVYDDGKPKYQGIDTSYLVATLTAAIQELNDKFEEYKASHP
jgi:hypothetical protein